eukprot:1344738-Prymnesium_polylepis.2
MSSWGFTVPRDFMLTRAQRRQHVRSRRRSREGCSLRRGDARTSTLQLHDGSAHLSTSKADTCRATGVTRRAAAVHREYELSAMHLDEHRHGTVLGM